LSKTYGIGYIKPMAEDTKKNKDDKSPEDSQKQTKKPIFLIIIIVFVMIMFVITSLTAIFLLKRPDQKVIIQKEELLILVPMREFLVNLLDYGGRRFLKVTIDFEVSNNNVVKEIQDKDTILRNYIINVLSNNSVNDIRSIEGKNDLRKTIIAKSNLILKTGQVLNVYFQEFIIQ
jgi:flagellar protein FliL